jgi:hypothetical protein
MNPRTFSGASCRIIAIIALLGACTSNNGGSGTSTGGTGGQKQGSSSGGSSGQTSAAAGSSASSSSKGGQGGQTSAAGGISSTSASTGQGGQSSTAGGASASTGGKSSQGGTTETRQDAGAGGRGGQTSNTSRPEVDANSAPGGTGGNSGSGGGTTSSKDASPTDASEVGHPRRVILVDEGNTRIHLMDLQNDSASIWTKQFTSFRDIQLVGGDRLAVTTQEGYVELDLKDGATKKEFKGLSSIETMRRLPNGNSVFGGNSDGGITIQELDSQDKPVSGHKMTFTGSNYGPLRLLRRTPQGTFLIGFGTEDNELAEVNWDKQIVWRMPLPSGKHTYQGLRLSDGTIAAAAGYAAALYIIDPVAKKVLTTIGGKSQPDAATIHPNFYAGFQVLQNGHIVVTNWQNHGAGHGNEGIQLLEYDQTGLLVWKWKQNPNIVSSLHGVMVIDGFDTSKLHDDVNGVLGPVTQ